MTSRTETQYSQSSTSSYPILNQSFTDQYEFGPNSIPPSSSKKSDWDDEIVPALRRKLEQQSQTLGKRLSRVQGIENWNSQPAANGTGSSRRDEMDSRFLPSDDEVVGIAVANGNRLGNKRQESVRREGASESATAGQPSSYIYQKGSPKDYDLESTQYSHKFAAKKGRKTEPYMTTTASANRRDDLGYGQPSTSSRNQRSFNHDREATTTAMMETDVGNQTFPTIQHSPEMYDPEEEPAGAEARKEYRIRTQSQPLAIRNSAAKDKARKAVLERENKRDGNSYREGNGKDRERDREYPPSSSRKVHQDEVSSYAADSSSGRVPRKVPSLGDTQHSIQNSSSPIPSYSKIPRPVRRDSETSRHSVRSERSDRSLRLQSVTAASGQISSGRGAHKGKTSSESGSRRASPNSPTGNHFFSSNPGINTATNTTPSNSHFSRSDSRKAARTPTQQQLEEFGPLGGSSNNQKGNAANSDIADRLGSSKKFSTAPSGLSSLIQDPDASSSRIGKSSQRSNSPRMLDPNRLAADQMNDVNHAKDLPNLSSSTLDSELRKSREDIRSNFYTTQQAKKWDDQLLPVVAKRLQAEAMRNARMSQFEGLVDTWDVNGLPLSYKNWNNDENDKNIENLLKEEEELKKRKEEELQKIMREGEEKRRKEEDEDEENRKRPRARHQTDRTDQFEMMSTGHQQNHIRAAQDDLPQQQRKEKDKKKKNDAGCCQCSIM